MFGIADKVLAYIAAGIAVLAIVAAVWLKIELAQTRADLDARTKERDVANASLVLQNTAVANWKSNAEAAQEVAAEAIEKAQVASRARRPAADALQGRILAANDTCASAVGEVRKAIGDAPTVADVRKAVLK